MAVTRACEELADFIAARTNPVDVAEYRPSKESRERVWDLVAREKTGELSADESAELGTYLQLEHTMHLVKARARRA